FDTAKATASSTPMDTTVGPNGNVWFTPESANQTGAMATPDPTFACRVVPLTRSETFARTSSTKIMSGDDSTGDQC
ncbi:MAG: hypothetical protein ACLQUY_18485, partial [Ktedonobacterales bacterium]